MQRMGFPVIASDCSNKDGAKKKKRHWGEIMSFTHEATYDVTAYESLCV